LLASGGRIVRGNWIGLTVSTGGNTRRPNAAVDQEIAHGLSPASREIEVIGVRTGANEIGLSLPSLVLLCYQDQVSAL